MPLNDTLVRWEESYRLGLDEIDDQHKMLFDIMNHLWKAIVRRAGAEEMASIINDLEQYTISHFTAEEAFMRSHGHSDFAQHKKQHDSFVARLREARLAAGQGRTVDLELLHFLREWLVNHIMVKDRAYAKEHELTAQPKSFLGRFFKKLAHH